MMNEFVQGLKQTPKVFFIVVLVLFPLEALLIDRHYDLTPSWFLIRVLEISLLIVAIAQIKKSQAKLPLLVIAAIWLGLLSTVFSTAFGTLMLVLRA
jgi:hypothetical protein